MMDVLKKTLEMLEQERLYAEDCKDVLIPALDAEDEDVLVQVLQFTSQLYSDRDVVLRHCELVKDDAQSEEVRAAAAIALGPAFEVYGFCDWEDPFIEPAVSQEEFEEIMEEFRRLYENEATPKKVRRKVLEAVVRANEDWVPQAVREAWERDDPKWKRTAVFGAGYTRGCRSVVMEGLESENEDILREALYAGAGKEDLPGFLSMCVSVARDPDRGTEVRNAAMYALSEIPADEASFALMDLQEEPGDVGESAERAYDAWIRRFGE